MAVLHGGMERENVALRDQLLALMNFPELDVPEYWASTVQRIVGMQA